VSITIKHEEFFAQQGERTPQRAAGAYKGGAIEAVCDLQAELPFIGGKVANHFAQMRDTQDHAVYALLPEQPQLVGNKWLAGHRNLGNIMVRG
jgi:hypothetical protein